MIIGGSLDSPTCSRAGCRARASSSVVWRNPRIHDAERRKVWLACDDHVGYLADFLRSRSFPVRVVDGVADGTGVPLDGGTP